MSQQHTLEANSPRHISPAPKMADIRSPRESFRLVDLPVELQVDILGQLHIFDIWRCLRVSREWKRMILGVGEKDPETEEPNEDAKGDAKDKAKDDTVDGLSQDWVDKWVLVIGRWQLEYGDSERSGLVLETLAQKHFPGFIEYAYATRGSAESRARLFGQIVDKFFFRSQGKFRYVLCSAFAFREDSYFNLDQASYPASRRGIEQRYGAQSYYLC